MAANVTVYLIHGFTCVCLDCRNNAGEIDSINAELNLQNTVGCALATKLTAYCNVTI